MTAKERIFLKSELKAILEYEKRTPEDIFEEIHPIINSYDKDFMAKELNCSIGTLKSYASRSNVIKKGIKPSYSLYIKLRNIPIGEHYKEKRKRKLSDAEKRAEQAKYSHDYYETVTKPKREAERVKLQQRQEREEKERKRRLQKLREEVED